MKNPADNPYQTGLAPSPEAKKDFTREYQINKREEVETHRAPKILPWSIESVVQQLGEVFVKLMEVKNMFDRLNSKPGTPKAKTVEKLQNQLDDINKQIFNLTNDLHDLTLGND